jgi:dTDP-4-dehydrorhamnose reductase
MLGRALLGSLGRRGLPRAGATRRDLDLTRLDSIEAWLRERRPAAVINAAGYTDVAGAERPEAREEAFRVNRDATRILGRACAKLGSALVHVSTDYVFDGELRRPYREDDPTGPLQTYGRSKLEGEQALRQEYPEALVARTSTLFGAGRTARPHYVDAILRQAQPGSAIEVVEPPVSSPTYAADLAEALVELLGRRATGLVHVVNDGGCSRLELARAVVEEAGLAGRVELRVRPASPGGPARPPYSILDTARLESILGRRLRPWRAALRAYLGERQARD